MNKQAFLVGYLQKEGIVPSRAPHPSAQIPNTYNPTKDLKRFYGDDFQKVLAARRKAIEQSKTKGLHYLQDFSTPGRESPTFRQPWKTGKFPQIVPKTDPHNSQAMESEGYYANPIKNKVNFPAKKEGPTPYPQINGYQDWMGNADFTEYTKKLGRKHRRSSKLHEFTHTSTYDIPMQKSVALYMKTLFRNLEAPYPLTNPDELAPPAAGLKRVHHQLTGRNFKNRQDFDKWTEWLVNLDPSVPEQEKMLKKIGSLSTEALRARNYLGYFKKEKALAKKNNTPILREGIHDQFYKRFKDFLYTISKLVVKANPSKTSKRRG